MRVEPQRRRETQREFTRRGLRTIMNFRQLQKIIFFVLCITIALASITDDGYAHNKGKSKKKPKAKSKNAIRITPGSQITPTHSGSRGTVQYYFFPISVGASWTHRTVRLIFDDSGKIVTTDTTFNTQRVVSNTAFSLQKLPLVKYESFGLKSGSKDTVRSDGYYYVDDSVAMTVFNNSVTNVLNRIFLVAPLVEGNAWREKDGDSTFCVIKSLTDSCITTMRKFDTALCTITRVGYSELRKYYAPGFGLVKSIYRTVGKGGHGIMAVVIEMTALTLPEEKKGK